MNVITSADRLVARGCSNNIPNLGAVIMVLARAEYAEYALHEDVDAYYEPSECHDLVSRGEAKRQRLARRIAESMCQRPMRVIRQQAKKRGGLVILSGQPQWQRIVFNICSGETYHGNK